MIHRVTGGALDIITNDNFKTFKYMLCHGVKQKLILPALLWWGGFYEQLVRSVNILLKIFLGKSKK